MSFINSSKNPAIGASGGIISDPSSELVLFVELLPAESNSNYQSVGARLSVGGEYVSIISFDETVSADGAGKSVTVGLARIEDKNLLTAGAEFLIETFELNNADEEPVWETALEGKISRKSLTVQNANGKPADTVTFMLDATERLKKSPNRNLVVYDAARADVDASEFEPVYDTFGRAYTIQTLEESGLSLYKLFDEIFVNRCGFASVKTNIPDYPIRRADFSIFETLYDGVKPFIGSFDAIAMQTADNVLWLTDATLALPPGFPAPRVIEAAKIQSISSEAEVERVEGFELQFSQSETGDFFTTKNQTFETEVRTRFGTLISRTVRKVKIRQYRSNYARRIVLREVIQSQTTTVYGADNVLPIQIETETFTFDYLGRQKQSVKIVQKRVPDVAAAGAVSLREVATDEMNHKYGVFPFSARRQFLKRTEFSSEGLIAVDAENQYFGGDFSQSVADAHRIGNLKEGMTETSGLIKSVTEEFKPLPDGTVKVLTTTIDHTPEAVGREAIVTTSQGEPRAGDVSVSASARASRLYVFPKDSDVLTGQKLEAFAVGEIPLNIAVPLARRRLKRKKANKRKLQIELVGWNKTITQGAVCTAMGREAESVNLIVEGYRRFARIENNRLEWGMTLTGAEI